MSLLVNTFSNRTDAPRSSQELAPGSVPAESADPTPVALQIKDESSDYSRIGVRKEMQQRTTNLTGSEGAAASADDITVGLS